MTEVRTRFAPSPTGGLHLGGVRTALFSYLFAKSHGGKFILRIEDTDQSRYVDTAEKYIIDCLEWCGISADEGPHVPGDLGPYRQSERKEIYRKYAMQLVESGHAYYAFDTAEELDQMRLEHKTADNPSPQYDFHIRMKMKNSLNMTESELEHMLLQNVPYVIRIRIPQNEIISFNDLIRGEIKNESKLIDDKVLLKADGMPTYHLAVVVDDYLMKITHAFRGEEWLPSAPVHILLWRYLGVEQHMPEWAHLPLILKPDGNGKLSKRDGDRLGFPVFAMDWTDPKTKEKTTGFKERGFLPEAFINMLAMLGWSSGEEKEIFSKTELIEKFSIERVHKAGAKFDFEKAKWYNHEWIKKTSAADLMPHVIALFKSKNIELPKDNLEQIISLVKDRCVLLNDFFEQTVYFFQSPAVYDMDAVKPKWNEEKAIFFRELVAVFHDITLWNTAEIEAAFKSLATTKNIKPGELQLPFRVMLVGGKYGPAVFQIAELIGKEETKTRINFFMGRIAQEQKQI